MPDSAKPLRGLVAEASSEELTPVKLDWMSVVPLWMTVVFLLTSPKPAIKLARGGFDAHLLDLGNIQMIESEVFR